MLPLSPSPSVGGSLVTHLSLSKNNWFGRLRFKSVDFLSLFGTGTNRMVTSPLLIHLLQVRTRNIRLHRITVFPVTNEGLLL